MNYQWSEIRQSIIRQVRVVQSDKIIERILKAKEHDRLQRRERERERERGSEKERE